MHEDRSGMKKQGVVGKKECQALNCDAAAVMELGTNNIPVCSGHYNQVINLGRAVLFKAKRQNGKKAKFH